MNETHFGADGWDKLRRWLEEKGVGRPLLLTTGPRFVSQARAALEGLQLAVFDGARVHVPAATVREAAAAFADHSADAVVSLGGGSAVGLGKALRLQHDVPFAALPTTYAGSERTSIWGMTDGADKKTGRDERVRPDIAVYVPEHFESIPPMLAVQSLQNALAHPLGALMASSDLDPEATKQVQSSAEGVFRAVLRVSEWPDSVTLRLDAARAAAQAAAVLDAHPMGLHHKVAHWLGGRFDLPHAALHSVLLAHSVAHLAPSEVVDALPEADPLRCLQDALRLCDAPRDLKSLGVEHEALGQCIEALGPEARFVEDAYWGRAQSNRLARRGGRAIVGDPERAHTVVVAVHGRGADAGRFALDVAEIVGDPEVCVVAPEADGQSWYDASYRDVRAEQGGALAAAVETLVTTRRWALELGAANVSAFGFSQGACVLLEAVGSGALEVERVVALAGARPPGGDTWSEHLSRAQTLLALAREDVWVELEDVRQTADALLGAGGSVTLHVEPGAAHVMAARTRVAARELLVGLDPAQSGFGNAHEVEARPGALPLHQNSPRKTSYGLYPEQISGTGFVAARHENQRSWVYRIRPAAGHPPFTALEHPTFRDDWSERPEVNLFGRRALEIPSADAGRVDFVDGIHTVGGQGRPELRRGYAIHLYAANASMEDRCLYNADGDLIILPETGTITLLTELGVLTVAPRQMAIVPRGLKFSVLLEDGPARGYMGEVFGRHFELPDRGVVGANGVTDERHFKTPIPYYEQRLTPGFEMVAKLGGALHRTSLSRSPYDVVAWHGNYVPYVYSFDDFSPVSNVAFDHIDPSAYLVLSAPLDERGADTLDLVVFPPRWDPTEHTFRPPFFHRNAITEFNGILQIGRGSGPFEQGMSFLTPAMTAHGVVDRGVERAIELSDAVADRPSPPSRSSLWFQFESALPLCLTRWAASGGGVLPGWAEVWGRYRSYFTG